MRNVSDRVVEKIGTNFICKNILGPGRPQMTIWRMHIACWIPKTTDTHSEYVIFIAFPRQQWLPGRASVLLFMFPHCPSCYNIASCSIPSFFFYKTS